MISNKQQIAVIGAGLMGHGIALTLARAGHCVTITDPHAETLNSAPKRISDSLRVMGAEDDEIARTSKMIEPCSSVASAVRKADYIFEAAPEKLDLKRQIFADVEAHAPVAAVLASNTSVIQITKIMDGLKHPERALGTHWWNPPHLIPLVEVIKTTWTDGEVADRMMALLASAGKTPVMVEKDVPGFIGNRLQHALWREAVSLVERGICDAEAVDTVVKSCFGRRLAVLGPLENADLVGTDLTLDIHENVLFDLESRQGPSPYLQQLVKDGKLGMKSGEGFRKWTEDEANAVRARVGRHLTRLGGILDD
ncbi:3-hydroxyacyl-CoA dehydrogenase family protein [Paracoccus sp. 1_MG-2023]|uniref:3-hydroxyacyl-CoA dehydrogenase family protein n=1 Tax=unclassified Paracoccus (in: a-proteobacteria) TaxID=2688777 RepID=UPI001C0805B8|nr:MULTISPECIES: 3-hydroxyacyl-CoA dehydrogenase family protein [unclassified Paracoccus (in: a-proteobacteria)]MBU2958882.1 3-hydroxyacyl-CoA dehydrogenase family protein [Paracoccus sp. C2R09]MDO6670256.1 3-hydroxyacyl-CoA dehydrogenase family protein [Paracoccus sp. 1_MG-2023]